MGIRRALPPILLCLLGPGLASCAAPASDPRPSILMVVFDTLRADAVSYQGAVEGVTPTLDALAADGLAYTRAYAPSPWTLPSHASLFTGLGQDRHRVGSKGGALLADDLVTLAERLRDAGYQTAAVSESLVVSDVFRMLQGFDWRRAATPETAARFDPVAEVSAWLGGIDAARPLFLFVNLNDPHAPYEIRDANPFVPDGATPAQIRSRSPRPEGLLCGGVPAQAALDIQRGLYLGDVREADAKLAAIRARLADAGHGDRLVTIATSDHGELLGEHRLMGHEFSLHDALLRVPLVVHGLPERSPAEIDAPVSLLDVAPSVLGWAGVPGAAELPGRSLPEVPVRYDATPRMHFAAYSDESWLLPPEWEKTRTLQDKDQKRDFCSDADRVFGAMASLHRYPHKYVWYERYPAQLFDLSWDEGERSDLSAQQPELAAWFAGEIEARVAASGVAADPSHPTPISDEAAEALRQLGYVE